MKIVTFKITVLFTMTLLLSGIVNSQNKDYKLKMTLNNVRTANLIITTQVVEKEQKIDTHNSKFETVRLIVKDIIEGNTKNDTIKISYYLNQIRDELFVIPKFEKGEDYVLVLYQDKNEGHTLLGGELVKFHLGTDKVNNVNFTKSELVSLLKRIRNNIQSDEDLITLNDLAVEMDGRLKLDGEFAIIHPKTKLKPLVQEGNELFVLLLELETHQLYNMGYKDEAMNNLKTILSKYNLNEDIEKQTLYRIGVFYLDFYNDKVNAQKTFDELAAKYPNDELLTYANLVLNEERYNVQGLKNTDQEIATVVK